MAEEKQDEVVTKVDPFGMDINPAEDTPVVVEKKEEKKEDGKVDIANHPEMVALKVKLEEYSNNLTGQRTAHEKQIADLRKQLEDKIAGKGGENSSDDNVMFKDIKFSKDLTQDERDDMTDTEIRLFDQNAQQQVAMNQLFATVSKASKVIDETKVEDLNSSARTEAMRLAEENFKLNPTLAKDVRELSDKIIVEFNDFNNAGITVEKLAERMKKALNNVTGYTPPKEKSIRDTTGKPIKTGGSTATDPYGIDSIVAGVNKKNDGKYSL